MKERKGLVIVAVIVLPVLALVVLVQAQVVGGRAPDFPIEMYRGGDKIGDRPETFHQVSNLGMPVVLNFWAGLCPPCRAEMPGFQRLYDKYGDDYIMLGVDVGPYVGLGTRQDALGFLEEFAITYPTARALSADPIPSYGIHGMPTTVFIAPDGKIFHNHLGYMAEEEAERQLLRLLNASTPEQGS